MKKKASLNISSQAKLSLRRETIAQLSNSKLQTVAGGSFFSICPDSMHPTGCQSDTCPSA